MASAQERSRPSTPSGSPVETSSQRLLRLPEGASTDLKQQVQWLQQLQGLMAAGSLGSDTSATPTIDPEQLNALLSAMKQLSEAVPQGTVLPKSDSQSSEQLFKMLSDPAVQEQARQLLKQFSQNGKLPPRSETGDSKSVPLPSASTPRSARPAPDLSAMPPAAQELMKRLLQQAGRQPKEPPNDPKSGDQKLKPAKPDRDRVEPDVPAPADKPKQFETSPKDVERSVTGPRDAGSRDDEPKTSLERAASELEAIMRDPRNELNRPPRPSETNRNPFGQPMLGNEKVDAGSRVSKPSKPQPEDPTQPEDPIRESPTTTPPSKPAVTPQNPDNTPKSPQMDVRSELQERGFTQTLRKLIDQTREESRAESNGSAGTSAGGQEAGNGSLSGLEKSITRLIDGLRKDTAREAAQAPAQSSTPMPTTTATPQPSTPPSGPERRSTAGKVFESIGNVFKEMAAAPDAQPGNPRPRQGRSASGGADSQRATSRSTGPLLMLLAALGLVWYFLPRVVTAVKESHFSRRSSSAGEVTTSYDIRTREDVVRAFHQYALQSAMSVPTWWTHREVERQVADTTPALKPSIQVLADLYELARYLPGEAELTLDQIGIARRELENVARPSRKT
ncbi:MAG: hypothetical protein IAG10_06130 [Planctomycetaceae bacterium]|nr:hypothetical protein [Planctomycetaceae bacterium]